MSVCVWVSKSERMNKWAIEWGYGYEKERDLAWRERLQIMHPRWMYTILSLSFTVALFPSMYTCSVYLNTTVNIMELIDWLPFAGTGIDVEGIFRRSTNAQLVKSVKDAINSSMSLDDHIIAFLSRVSFFSPSLSHPLFFVYFSLSHSLFIVCYTSFLPVLLM